ncbi:DUF2842 domain-containing protein [Brevundimonas sp.]|uniref:DUF2842 domain-containing protein n=1 Tax=Brevundimonas sp. TaxID=1871086 RepID=UPI0028992853|nr:DUF2842 domain-containing protein [Brevundimonas sp.]
MSPRLRKLIAAIMVMAFLTFWVWGAVTLSGFVPDIFWVEAIYYAIAGIGWGIPLIPMLRWAEKPGKGAQNHPADPR